MVSSAQQSSISLVLDASFTKVAQIKNCPYFGLKALDQNGHEQVEEDVVAEGHEGDKIEGGQRRGGGHPVIEHRVPVLLGEDLQYREVEVKRM